MRAVIQRVQFCSVEVDNEIVSKIKIGFLVLLGIEEEDTSEDIKWLSKKICNIRLFNDDSGVMNLSLIDINAEALVVSQFTLHAKTKKGNRPSYIKAAKPDVAIPVYQAFLQQLEKDLGKKVAAGIFGADMKINLLNDGPVTIIIDTKNKDI